MLIVNFIYNNTKIINISYILSKLNYNYYLYIFFFKKYQFLIWINNNIWVIKIIALVNNINLDKTKYNIIKRFISNLKI